MTFNIFYVGSKYPYFISYHSLWLLAPNRYESDPSNEVLSALLGEEAAKISEVKVGGW